MHIQSYCNTIKVILAVDEEQFPDPRQLLDDFAESLNLTKDAAAKASTKLIKNEQGMKEPYWWINAQIWIARYIYIYVLTATDCVYHTLIYVMLSNY